MEMHVNIFIMQIAITGNVQNAYVQDKFYHAMAAITYAQDNSLGQPPEIII